MAMEASTRHARAASFPVGQEVEAPLEDRPEELRTPSAAIKDDRDAALAHGEAHLAQDLGQHAHKPGIGLCGDHEERIARAVVDPVIGRRGQRKVPLGHMGLGQATASVVHPHMPVGVEHPHGCASHLDTSFGQRPTQFNRPVVRRQSGELASERLDLGRAVQTDDAAEFTGRMLLERLGALDPQQRQEKHRKDGGAQAIEGGSDMAIGLAGDLEDAAADE